MARPKRRKDASMLEMALVGYEIERQKITEKIAEIQGKLGGRGGAATSGESEPPKRKRRRMSAAARKRIADATRKRWAAFRKAKAGKQ
jgi:hypothetical protein